MSGSGHLPGQCQAHAGLVPGTCGDYPLKGEGDGSELAAGLAENVAAFKRAVDVHDPFVAQLADTQPFKPA